MGKRKEILKSCGNCHICGKEHMSNEGGWVINVRAAEKQKVVINDNNDKRMNMYIEYLKQQKCKHKYATE
jgi:ribosomal protein L21E